MTAAATLSDLMIVEWDGGPADVRDAARDILLWAYPRGGVADRVRHEAAIAARLDALGSPAAITRARVRGWIEVEQRANA